MNTQNSKNFNKIKLKNGITLLFEKRNSDVSSVFVGFKVGSAHEIFQKKGIAHFVEHNLFKGSQKRTQQEISSGIEKKGGILNGFTSEETTAYWAKLPSNYTIYALDILSDMALNPKFSKEEMEKERKVVLEEIKMYHDNPQLFVIDEIRKRLYNPPFNIGGLGTPKSVLSLNQSDLLSWHKLYNGQNMIVSIVGNSKIDEIKNYLENIKLKNINLKVSPRKPIIEKNNSQKVYFRQGIDQAHVALGIHVPSMASKERYSLELFNMLLGGGMSSPLFQEIREKRGLVYAVKSFVDSEKSYGSLIVYAGTEKKKVKQVKETTLKVIKSIENTNSKDFEQAKEQCIGLNKVINEKSDYVAKDLFFNEVASDAKEHYKYNEEISKLKIKDIKKFSKIGKYSFTALIPK